MWSLPDSWPPRGSPLHCTYLPSFVFDEARHLLFCLIDLRLGVGAVCFIPVSLQGSCPGTLSSRCPDPKPCPAQEKKGSCDKGRASFSVEVAGIFLSRNFEEGTSSELKKQNKTKNQRHFSKQLL